MRVKRILAWLAAVLVLAAVAAGVFYALAGRQPSAFQPLELSEQQQKTVTSGFVGRMAEFRNAVVSGQPFTWSISAGEINEAIASMDAIAALPMAASAAGSSTNRRHAIRGCGN